MGTGFAGLLTLEILDDGGTSPTLTGEEGPQAISASAESGKLQARGHCVCGEEALRGGHCEHGGAGDDFVACVECE